MLLCIHDLKYSSIGSAESENLRLSRSFVKNVFEELTCRKHQGYVIEVDDVQALLIGLERPYEDREELCQTLTALVQEGADFLEQTFGISLIIGISGQKTGVGAIHEAYAEGYTTLEYNILMGNPGPSFYHEIELGLMGDNQSYYYYYPLQMEVQLTNFIKAGDYDSAKQILDRIFDVNFNQNTLPGPIVRCFMFNLISTIMKTVYELSSIIHSNQLEELNAVETLLQCKSVTEIHTELNRVLVLLCQFTQHKSNGCNLTDRAIAFIESHYMDVALSVPMIADNLRITASYLSKKFKDGTGAGLWDYINQFRINKAIGLLHTTSMNIADIAAKCGFVNSNTFIRTFKKYQGVTPGRFRSLE